MDGILYLCATPIGNLGDISARCLEVLKNADLIAAEDTRHTLQLLNHFGISKPLTSYYEHNKKEKGEYLISLLKEGKNIALVSDAGTPAISDPGEDLVKLCIVNGINVTSIPGPVAAINALILSGFSAKRFMFEGFLPPKKKQKLEALERFKNYRETLIFYEAPHKLKDTLCCMLEVFGSERKLALAREMTKLHEEVMRMTVGEAVEYYNENAPRGEYVLVAEGTEDEAESKNLWWDGLSVCEHVDWYIECGSDKKEAVKQAAKDRNVPKRDVYNEYHGI